VADANCDLRCTNCQFDGSVIVVVSKNSRVVFEDCTIRASQMVGMVRDKGVLKVVGDTELDVNDATLGFRAEGASTLHLGALDLAATYAIQLKGLAVAELDGTKVDGSAYALTAERGAVVRARNEKISGRVKMVDPIRPLTD
jgi:hypothetical protein